MEREVREARDEAAMEKSVRERVEGELRQLQEFHRNEIERLQREQWERSEQERVYREQREHNERTHQEEIARAQAAREATMRSRWRIAMALWAIFFIAVIADLALAMKG